MIKITSEQKTILKKHLPEYENYLSGHINDLLIEIDDLIIGVGMINQDILNEDGRVLQRLYDQLYNQN